MDDAGGRCRWCAEQDVEFGWWPRLLGEVLPALDETARLAATCQGSGDRPGLAVVADALHRAPRGAGLVVDVGSGTGGPAEWLRRAHGIDVLAAEPSQAAARLAATAFPATHVVRAAADRLPLGPGSARAVLLVGVLSVLRDPGAALDEARRVLHPDGRLVVADYVIETALGTASDAEHGTRLPLPPGSHPVVLARLVDDLSAAGWDVSTVHVGDEAPDAAWAAGRRRADVAVRRHVARTPHGVGAACPTALRRLVLARRRLGAAIASGALRRVTLVAVPTHGPNAQRGERLPMWGTVPAEHSRDIAPARGRRPDRHRRPDRQGELS